MALVFNTPMRDVGWLALAFTTYLIGVTFGKDVIVDVMAKHVTQLRINWTIQGEADTLKLEYAKKDYPGRTTIELVNNATEFTIEDLVANTKYNVCVHVTKTSTTFSDCKYIKTIPVMRDDSIIALIVVILIVILLIGAGFCYQRYRRNVLDRKMEQDEQGLQAHENNIDDEDHYEHPKSAIEDEQVNVRL